MTVSDRGRAAGALIADFARKYPSDVARVIERLPAAAAARQLQAAPSAQAARVLELVAPDIAANVLAGLADGFAARVLAVMEPGRAVSMLGWLDPPVFDRYVALVDPAAGRELRALASYPADSAGRLMDPRVVAMHGSVMVRDALTRVRKRRSQLAGDVFIVDDEGRLAGAVALQDLAIARFSETIGRLARPVAGIAAVAPRAEVMERLTGGSLTTLPVVDADDRLVGAIRPATLLSVAQEEAGADVQTMVGASRDERALSKVSFAVRKRLPWLHINLATAFLAAAVVGLFEDTIAQFTALAVLLPVVAGQSGNTGAQALAVTMRGLTLREVRPRQWMRIGVKEGSVALMNGCAVAITTSAGVLLWSQSPGLALVIGVAMVISMFAAGLAGALIPVVLTVSGQDPAQASSIILTTVTDVVGFLSFLGLAAVFASAL